MADNDFDIDGLAKFLHLTPQQIEKLVSRDQVPARRVSGEWKFSASEIHHWMEERMGLLEEAELAQVEGAMTSDNQEETSDSFLIREMLSVETIALPLLAKTKNAVIEQMSQLAATTGMLWDPGKMADAIRSREQLQSTAMDSGVALLHPRRPLSSILGEAVVAIGISPAGIPFGGSRNLTDIFFLLCSTDDRNHLRILARLSRLISTEGFLDSMRHAASAKELYELICDAESELT